MAVKNMIKVGQRVKFGRAGQERRTGRVVRLNPKTAHIKLSNGDVMGASYGLIQVLKGNKKSPAKAKARLKAKKNPARVSTSRKPRVALTYAAWLATQNKTKLRALEKALNTIAGSASPATKDAKSKLVCVRKELRKRK